MRYKITLAYDGKKYHGWQIQPNATTVQEVVNKCLSITTHQNIEVVGCGRTDTGVSATYYVGHFDADIPLQDIQTLVNKLNRFLPKDIVIFSIEKTNDEFNARFDAKTRTYKYFLHNSKDPFLNDKSWFYPYPIDINNMNQACEILKKNNDFACFCKAGADNKTTICNIFYAKWTQENHKYMFEITANRFLRNMVRAIVGTLTDIGTGKTTVSDLENIIKSKKRSNAGASVAAEGLFLVNVTY